MSRWIEDGERIELTRVEARIRVSNAGGSVEAAALFDTGSTLTYVSEAVAERIGFNPYARPRKAPLAVLDKEADVIGELTVSLEIDGCPMPRRETLEAVRGLRFDAVVGLDIIEKYGVILDAKSGRVKLKSYPPEALLISLAQLPRSIEEAPGERGAVRIDPAAWLPRWQQSDEAGAGARR